MKHIFIVDPNLGKARCFGKAIEQIDNLDYKVFYETDREKIKKITNSLFGTSYILYCVGGDDILNVIVNGLEYQVPIHIIPVGYENNFYEQHKNINNNLLVDIGILNGTEKFVNSAHLGINEKICMNLYKDKKNLLDIIRIKKYLISKENRSYDLEIDGILENVISISIHLGTCYENDRKKTKNGYFSIYQLNQHNYQEIVKSSIKNLDIKNHFFSYNANSLSIHSDIPISFELDGIKIKNTDFEFDIAEERLEITNNIPNSIKKLIKKIR